MDEKFTLPDELWILLEDPLTRLILVIGASDTGKTTFVEYIARKLANLFNLGIVDLDMGQSQIGPPTTVGWARCPENFTTLSTLKEEDFYFTGTITPAGSLLPAITGARLIVERAMKTCDKVIVDTTGLISEPAGRVLKHFKIDILKPDLVVCLERTDELSHIKAPFKNQSLIFYTLRPPSGIRQKSPSERAEYRYKRMESYLADSKLHSFPISELGILFTRERLPFDNPGLKNRVVSFRNSQNRDIAIGVIEAVKPKEGKIFIRTHELREKPVTIVIGKAVMDNNERSLRNVSPLI
ncbi:MAG: Clp1/GlmU family protein [Thermodesulfovibrionales bacterium]|nr:Clp1/GlmU family protein [Thermodesulfovibrionales bacterium]